MPNASESTTPIPARDATALGRLDRWDRQLWIIATLVMAALAAALVVMQLSHREVTPEGRPQGGSDVTFTIAMGLLALVGLFTAYLFSKRRQIRRLQAAIFEEQTQNLDLSGRLENLQHLIRAARAFDVVPTVRNLLPRVISESVRLVGAERAYVWLRGESGQIELMDAYAVDDHRPEEASALVRSFLDREGAASQPRLFSGQEALEQAFEESSLIEGCGSMIVCPLRTGGRPFGALVVQRVAGEAHRPFLEEQLRLLWILAGFAAYVLTVARTQRRQREINRELRSSMSKLQTAQERLVHVEKLTAVGELVSGVAHELNNPLTSLLGYTQLLASLGEDQLSANRHLLDEVQKEALRCSGIVQNLASFARPPSISGEHEGLAQIIQSTVGLKAYALRSAGVDLVIDVEPGLPAPAVDRGLVQQVLLNLINNALFALRSADTPRLEISATFAEERLRVVVQDNGCGIARDDLGQIFEPFFSTRPKNEGIGLGLHTCVTILSEHGGSISVASQQGEGAVFTISLPVTAPTAVA